MDQSNKSNLSIAGERTSGQDVRTQNVTAALSVANIVKTSLGPVGLDKMLVDEIGDVTITNDGATILKLLEVEHPAARILVELAGLQDDEVGDGTTSVVIIAAELLRRANELVKNKIHPTTIMAGYRIAMKEATKYIQNVLAVKADKLDREMVVNIARTSLWSKILNTDIEKFANLAVDAVMAVKTVSDSGKTKFPVKSINILKAHGKSALESELMNGYAITAGRCSMQMPYRVENAKIAVLDIDLKKAKMHMGVQVVINNPRDLEGVQQREADITKERIDLLLKAGCNVILTTKGIDDMTMKYMVEGGVIGVRRVKKEDARRICKTTGAQMILSFGDMDGNESFDGSMLGSAEVVREVRIADDEILVFEKCKNSKAATVMLRGANDFMVDEMERSLHDAMCIVKRTLESGYVVPGGGSVEAALSIYLDNFAETLGAREQLAIAEFAEALLVIPKTLAINAAQDATDLVAKLRAFHNTAQKDSSKSNLKHSGLDLVNGKVRNNVAAGVVEPAMSKIKSIQFATEAAITILRIDDMIRLDKQEEEQ